MKSFYLLVLGHARTFYLLVLGSCFTCPVSSEKFLFTCPWTNICVKTAVEIPSQSPKVQFHFGQMKKLYLLLNLSWTPRIDVNREIFTIFFRQWLLTAGCQGIQWLLTAGCHQRFRYCQPAVTSEIAADSQSNLWMIL